MPTKRIPLRRSPRVTDEVSAEVVAAVRRLREIEGKPVTHEYQECHAVIRRAFKIKR
jgi:hypothetical protein